MQAWITPDEASEDTRLIEIRVPDDTYLYSCFIGALLILTDPQNWQQLGTLTPEEVVALFAPTWEDAYSYA